MMVWQDKSTYTCSNYIDLNRERSLSHKTEPTSKLSFKNNKVDAVCREKMCKRNYQIYGYFNSEREIVAVFFLYLNQFVGKRSCDWSAFKLVAINQLHFT